MLEVGMTRHYNVITVGEATIDAFMTLEQATKSMHMEGENGGVCFRHGSKIIVDRYDFEIGGNATNVAVGLNRLGVKSTLVAEVGDDEFSIKIRNCLANERIERTFITETPGPSNFSVIINFNGDRTIFAQNVERKHDFHLVDVTADLIFLTSLGNDWKNPYKKVLQFIDETGTSLAFNPGSRQLKEGKELVLKVLEKTQMVFLNKEEAEIILTGKQTMENDREYIHGLMEKVQKLGPATVVVTNGKRGSYALDGKGEFHYHNTLGGEVVERTGAGDAYTSGFLAASLYGLSLPKAMEWGSQNASSVVGKVGAHPGLLSKVDMEERVGE
jgi:sugar/nucleoside kinase (ribokinase family)